MTYRIIWEPGATSAAVRFLADDPTGLAAVYEAVDTLAKAPRPANSTAYGPDARRLRVGRYRVLYLIDDDLIRILVANLGRTP
ncbi:MULTISPECIES: type II toxin-antitoxin system RelE family toxin [Streptomyces]|uniref:type II toxin-antitoxin system RelE family toxin n=1 Tax=Streptomyces TaxID=1883 RepID=UPI000A382309|nr:MULTISPECIES: type II toxin-antitoxin system RelE/ParE family toxin [Streptomyces]MDX3582682.1 type II toxin-antitoxin system RelE/ParE family toxin [Streptomyces europaeiscabiei]MDX3618845.1 type II toxin-antitoxin system RelE/ParE family toxin [Streptomyces europaeiscabiei]MDX3634500.1 type II toxin-antitoxin system RelE/ParE family toxin [Streptomyces europaeiscabiei]MDX3653344.1 type II toxin-antitoxin system RelE/ParE family toxin [Streptomyces europaeiscabiei]WUD33250.1 type II toxin-